MHLRSVGYSPQCHFSPGPIEEQTKQSFQCDQIESSLLGLKGISGADLGRQCGPSHGQQDDDCIHALPRWKVEPSTLGRGVTHNDMGTAKSFTPVSCPFFSAPQNFLADTLSCKSLVKANGPWTCQFFTESATSGDFQIWIRWQLEPTQNANAFLQGWSF